jgi:hypothetical protein
MAVTNLIKLQLDQKTKDEIDALIQITRLTRFYCKTIAENVALGGEAKQDIKILFNACNAWLKRLEMRSTNKEVIHAHLERDFQAWGTIIRALTYMNDQQVEGVERFAEGIVGGSIQVELSGADNRTITINNEKL